MGPRTSKKRRAPPENRDAPFGVRGIHAPCRELWARRAQEDRASAHTRAHRSAKDMLGSSARPETARPRCLVQLPGFVRAASRQEKTGSVLRRNELGQNRDALLTNLSGDELSGA